MRLATGGLRSIAGLAAAGALAAGCGGEEPAKPVAGRPDPQHVREVAGDPYALTCGDIADQHEHPDGEKLVIGVEFALARQPELERHVARMTENRVGRSVYWALTEMCKGKERSFEPGRAAVDAVQRGKYLVQPRSSSWRSADSWWKEHPEDKPKPRRR